MDLRLTLENPKWAQRVAESAKEYTAKGNYNDWMEVNGYFGHDPKVLAFIEANRT